MTNEHDSLKTLLQNTGIVKSINRGIFNRTEGTSAVRLRSQFKNPVNVDKCMLILNFGDAGMDNGNYMSGLGAAFSDVQITSTEISVISLARTTRSNGGTLYWQVIEFYWLEWWIDMSSDDILDLKAINKQIDLLNGSLETLKKYSINGMTRSCYCYGNSVNCNTSSMLISICNREWDQVANTNAKVHYLSQPHDIFST